MLLKSKCCSNKSTALTDTSTANEQQNFPFLKASKFDKPADEEYQKENLCLEILLGKPLLQNKELQNSFCIRKNKTFKTRPSYSGEFDSEMKTLSRSHT